MVNELIYRYHAASSGMPTIKNIHYYLVQAGWQATRWRCRAHFSEQQLNFAPAAAATLEAKHSLHALLKRHQLDFTPETVYIDDHNWPEVLNKLTLKPAGPWILKPALLNNGQQIHLFHRLSDVIDHYLTPQRLGGPHVLQRYVAEPHLLQGPSYGHKYSLRLFVLMTDFAGGYIFPEGYFNVALQPYDAKNFSCQLGHLTNEHLQIGQPNVVQVPTSQYALFKPFYPTIKHMASQIYSAIQAEYNIQPRSNTGHFALFGFDFMVDANHRVWLLEVNHGACFPTQQNHPLMRSVYQPMWQSLIADFIQPQAVNQKPTTSLFELLC